MLGDYSSYLSTPATYILTKRDTMIFDHIVLSVTNLANSKLFYSKALSALGMPFIREEDGCIGFGSHGKPSLWLYEDNHPHKPMHIAFIAPNRMSVDAFHLAALAAGGKDNGAPGLRPQYHHDYYGAFIIDPDGHNIEAVYRQPE